MAFLHSHLLIHLLAIPIIILTFAISRKVDALNCYICAEGGLEEFGECKMSFPFNCDGYARRYAPTEKIFCRTTRHKTFNGTHTVVKECIAESAHYATFARKSQSLDEECDVLDLNGFEVAYCLCRDADLCNSAPIVDQFTEFENKHPDLFDPIPASNEASTGDDIDTAAEQRTTTITVDNHRFLPHPGEELTLRPKQPQEEDQQQQQLGEHSWPTTKAAFRPNPFAAPPRPAAENANAQKEQETVLRGTRIGQQQPPEEEAEEEAEDNGNGNGANSREELEADTSSGNDQLNSGAFVTAPAATASTSSSSGGGGAFGPLRRPNSDERPEKSHGGGGGESTGTGTQLGLLPELQCMQCNDQNLPNSASDCRHQIVISCPDQSRQLAGIGRPLCLTKQSQNGNGRGFSVEKQCTTERGILNEVGGRKAADLLNAAIRDELACLDGFCVCSSAQCNRPSLAEQQKSGAVLEPTTQRTNAILGSTGGSSHLLEVNSPAIQTEALNCAVCLDVELRDPKADCRNARTKNCAQELHNEKAFCLTRQTQNGKDGFIVEKSCVSRRQFYQQFPEELDRHSGQQAPLGCASTYEGAVSYCLCDGQMCNREGIAKQQQQQQPADLQGNKKSSASPFPGTNSFIDEDNGQQQQQQPQTTAATRRPAATAANFTTAAGGGAWERQEDGDALAGTGHATKIHPAPANFGPTSFVATSAAAGWTTTSTPPSTTPATSTTATSALRDRLEKWKANSEAGGGKKTAGRQRMDIFDELAEENSAAAAFGGWTTKWLTFALAILAVAAKANIV